MSLNIDEFIARAKDPNDTFRLMGFGHRVYKNYDPRAKVMRETCYEVLEAVGAQNDPIFKLAMELEQIALKMIILLRKNFILMSIFILVLLLAPLAFLPICLLSFLL